MHLHHYGANCMRLRLGSEKGRKGQGVILSHMELAFLNLHLQSIPGFHHHLA